MLSDQRRLSLKSIPPVPAAVPYVPCTALDSDSDLDPPVTVADRYHRNGNSKHTTVEHLT